MDCARLSITYSSLSNSRVGRRFDKTVLDRNFTKILMSYPFSTAKKKYDKGVGSDKMSWMV